MVIIGCGFTRDGLLCDGSRPPGSGFLLSRCHALAP
jgi:hypothetical protein